MRILFYIAPVNLLVSLTWHMWALKKCLKIYIYVCVSSLVISISSFLLIFSVLLIHLSHRTYMQFCRRASCDYDITHRHLYQCVCVLMCARACSCVRVENHRRVDNASVRSYGRRFSFFRRSYPGSDDTFMGAIARSLISISPTKCDYNKKPIFTATSSTPLRNKGTTVIKT